MSKRVLLMNPLKRKTRKNPPGALDFKEVGVSGAVLVVSGLAANFIGDQVAKQIVVKSFTKDGLGKESSSNQSPEKLKTLSLFGGKAAAKAVTGGIFWYLARHFAKNHAPRYADSIGFVTLGSIGANVINDGYDLFQNISKTEAQIAAEQIAQLKIPGVNVIKSVTSDYLQLNDLMPTKQVTNDLTTGKTAGLATDYISTDDIANEGQGLQTDDYLEADGGDGDGTQEYIDWEESMGETNDYVEF